MGGAESARTGVADLRLDPARDSRYISKKARISFLILSTLGLLRLDIPGPLAAQAEKPVPVERKIRLKVEAESWRPEGAYPIEKELRGKLARAGIEVVKSDTAKVDGVVSVNYEEEKGKEYQPLGGGESLGNGSNLTFSLTLLNLEEKELLSVRAETKPPDFIQKKPFDASLEVLHDHPIYHYLEHFVGAALGLHSSYSKMLPALTWEDSRKTAEDLIKQGGYKPASPLEEAYMAIGREDWEACVRIGGVATEPLLDLYERQTRLPGGLDEKVHETLVAIGGAKVKAAFLGHLHSRKDQIDAFLGEVLALIGALAKLGETGAIPVLEEYSQVESEEVAKEAKKALRILRAAAAKSVPRPEKAAATPESSGNAAADRFGARGLERLRAEKWNAAAACFAEAIELAPGYGPFYWNRARSFWNTQQWEEALADFERAASRAPALEDEARLRIFLIQARTGGLAKAKAELKEYFGDRPAGPDGPWFEAVAKTLLGEQSPAKLLEAAGAAAERRTQASFYLGMKALLGGDKKEASALFKEGAGGAGFDAESARVEQSALERSGR